MPNQFFGYYRRGFFKYCTDDFDGAIEDFTTALVLQPHYTYALVERGECYKHKGDMKSARADYITALKESMARDSVHVDNVSGQPTDFDVDDRSNLSYITYDDDCNAQYAYLGLGKKDFALPFRTASLSITMTKEAIMTQLASIQRWVDTIRQWATCVQLWKRDSAGLPTL